MNKRTLGRSGLQIAPLVFGGNVFGWTADEKTSFELLDGFVAAGLNAVDTADIYSAWVKGNRGGESETIIGKWFKRNPGNRAKVVLITKVGSEFSPEKRGLSERWITQAIEDSLRRLQTDYVDLYLSHRPDPHTPYEETLRAFEKLLRAGQNPGRRGLEPGCGATGRVAGSRRGAQPAALRRAATGVQPLQPRQF